MSQRPRESLFPGLGEMAEAAAVVWVRGPGVGCRAVRDVSAACSVQDLIHRHCQDQVRFAVPGRRGKEPAGQGTDRVGCERGLVWSVCSLGLSVFLRRGSSVLRCFKLILRAPFAFWW